MNKAVLTQVVRSFLPELAIGSACCAAGYFFLVDPLIKKVADAQAEVDALTLTISRSQAQPVPPVTGSGVNHPDFAKDTIETITARSALAADQARLLQAVSTLADSCSVRIEQFNPATPRAPRPIAGQPPAKIDPRIEQRTALSISLTGAYADTARFVRAMQQDVGFTAVRSLRIIPTGASTPDMVSVNIDTEHVAVNPKALAARPPVPAQPTAATGIPGPQAAVPSEPRQ